MVVDLGAQGADDGAWVVADENRGPGGGLVDDPAALGVGQDDDGTAGHGLGGEAGTVDGEAGQAREELARGGVTGVDANPQDTQILQGGGVIG